MTSHPAPHATPATIVDLTDDQARRAMPCKWGEVAPDVLPAWVAEMDYALAPPIAEALTAAIADGITGYPSFAVLDGPSPGPTELGAAYAGFAERRFGHRVDPMLVLPVSDVTAGVRLALDVLSGPGPVVLPLPAYPPQLYVAQVTGRERVDLVLGPDAPQAGIDLAALDAALVGGGRTLLLTQPHNPWGRVFTRAELEAIRDVVVRRGARVVSDEIHAPLAMPGVEHVPYLSIEGTAEHAVAVVAASKAFNTAGLRCAQLVCGDAATHERLRAVPAPRNDSWSPLGVIAAIAAYTDGDAWLDALQVRLAAQRDLLGELLTVHLPEARMRPVEATYLAWLDLRAHGHDDPASVALERGRVRVNPGHDFAPGLVGHVRLNFATSAARLTEVVRRLALGLS